MSKRYKITIGGHTFEATVEEISPPEPTPTPTPTPEPTPDPTPGPTPEPSQVPLNVQRLIDGGWKPEPKSLLKHPTGQEIKEALIPPASEFCSKRLWIPREFKTGNYDPVTIVSACKNSGSMQKSALRAWYELDVNQNTAAYNAAMVEAKAVFHSQLDARLEKGTPFTASSTIIAAVRHRDHFTAILALDWIDWDSAEEYETAFDKVKRIIEITDADNAAHGQNFTGTAGNGPDGYWDAGEVGDLAGSMYCLLALTAYGVNPKGASHAWASDILDRLQLNPHEDHRAIFSPWHLRNCSELISLVGGGREWGAYERGPGFGGYEVNWAIGITWLLHAADTATNNRWKLVDESLYLQTRHIGLAALEDMAVEQTAIHSTGVACLEVWTRLTSKGQYCWLLDRAKRAGNTYMIELQALAGPRPQESMPSGEFFDRVGSRLFYKENLAKPEQGLRGYFHYRNIDDHREMGDDRVMGWAYNNVGLVSGHPNRCAPSSALANGIFYGEVAKSGDPIIADQQFWIITKQQEIYHSPLRLVMPQVLLDDPRYLKGTQDKPQLVNGVWKWTRDWTESSGIAKAITHYTFDPKYRIIILEDEIECNEPYIGWHFSPNCEPKLNNSGFSFGDGTNEMQVTITGNVPLAPTVRREWKLDGYTLPLEYHSLPLGGTMHRIAANVGYVPQEKTGLYRVTTTIEAR